MAHIILILYLYLFLPTILCSEIKESTLNNQKVVQDNLKSALTHRRSGDIEKAKIYYLNAIHYNSSEAMNDLGEIYMRGEFKSEINYQIAGNYFRQAIYWKNKKSLYNLAFMVRFGLVSETAANSTLYLFLAAVFENQKASLALGAKHHMGYGTPKSCQGALKYYLGVSSKVFKDFDHVITVTGYRPILSKLKTEGVFDSESIEHIKLRAKEGLPDFQVEYAKICMGLYSYLNYAQDYKKAYLYFKLAADSGNAEAMEYIGVFYERGIVMLKNIISAIEFYQKAIESGRLSAHNRLGEIYFKGVDQEKDLKKAFHHYSISANSSNVEGRLGLAKVMNELNMDKSQIEVLLRLSASAGYAPAIYEIVANFFLKKSKFPSCELSVRFLRECAKSFHSTQKLFDEALQRYESGDFHHSLLLYMDLSFQGYTSAHKNAAFLLEKHPQKVKNFGAILPVPRSALLTLFEENLALNEAEKTSNSTANETESDKSPRKSSRRKWNGESRGLFKDPFRNSAYHFLSLASDRDDAEAKRKLADFHISNSGERGYPLLFSHQSFYLYKALARNGASIRGKEGLFTAFELYSDASTLNDAHASFNLGYMYQFGLGVGINFDLAEKLYYKSVNQSNHSYFPVIIFKGLMLLQKRGFPLEFLVKLRHDIPWDISEADWAGLIFTGGVSVVCVFVATACLCLCKYLL